MSRYRSTSVHLLGGCNASSSSSSDDGVCSPNGEVFDHGGGDRRREAVHGGLYVCDASLVPCSVGLNPALTIAAAAEHVSGALVSDVLRYRTRSESASEVEEEEEEGEEEEGEGGDGGTVDKAMYPSSPEWIQKAATLTGKEAPRTLRRGGKVAIRETLRGYIGGAPCIARLVLKMNSSDAREEEDDEENGGGDCRRGIYSSVGEAHPMLRGEVGGYVEFKAMNKEKLFVVDGGVNMCEVDGRTPYKQYMHYRLVLASSSGSRYLFDGKKVMNPYFLALNAWRETRTLHVSFTSLGGEDHGSGHRDQSSLIEQEKVDLRGELSLTTVELLKSIISIRGELGYRFVLLLLQTFWRTYFMRLPRRNPERKSRERSEEAAVRASYPPSTLHALKTGDGYIISCRQWRWNGDASKGGMSKNPVLLLDGNSGESYCLPTETKDLVRALLEEGHETWVLQQRTHPTHCSNDITIEDIARFDIPAAIAKILQTHEPYTKIHIIGHCVGGLAIHIAILGGYVRSAHIASVACTNSSMFFKLNTWARIRMRLLPLFLGSSAIIGESTVTSKTGKPDNVIRRRFARSVARLVPRHESCAVDECNIFSGVFGNAFWHDNVSENLHQWLNKEPLTRLPLSILPHLRKICALGFVIDPSGRNEYLVHPERMAVPTLYISGGRAISVTPETSLLAHRYMKLHQPRFQHRRVVIEGFGHSDLLIGEEAHTKVFPHFITHIKSVEKGGVMDGEEELSRMSSSLPQWDGEHDGDKGFGAPHYFIYLVVLLFFILSYCFSFSFYLV